jgi:hypothetical protein
MGGTFAVFVAAFAYFWLFRTYGFQVEDEGTLLFQVVRALDGERPYIDFHTGYGPVFFSTAGYLFELAGRSVIRFRLFLAVVNAAAAAGLFVLAGRIAGPRLAAAAPVLWVAFIPVFVGEHASFNIPYPAWFATFAWVVVAWLAAFWSERGRLVPLACAGVVAAFAFAVKLNAGAFSLAAVVWTLCLFARCETGLDRFAARAAAAVMAFGVWASFGFPLAGIELVTLLSSVALVAFVAAGPGLGRFAKAMHPRAMPALIVLGAAFVIPTAMWAHRLLGELGVEAFAREVLLLGSGAAELYYTGPPTPQPYALAAGLGAAALALAGRTATVRRVPVFALFAGAAAVVVAVAVLAVPRVLMPEGPGRAVLTQLENSTFWLLPLVNVAGALLLLRLILRRPNDAFARHLAVAAPFACAMYLQLFPRTDFMHVVMAAPLSLVLAAGLLSRTIVWWSELRWPANVDPRRFLELTGWLFLIAVVGLEASRSTSGVFAGLREVDPPDSLPFGLAVEREAADDLRAFEKARAYLADRASAGEPVLAFPALSGMLFASNASSPVPHDYWFPGRPGHEDEARMLAGLESDPPRYAVALNRDWTFFADAPGYFAATRDFVRERYALAARFGRYDVFERKDLGEGAESGTIPEWLPAGPRTDAITAEVAYRRQATARWLNGITRADVARNSLPADPREAVLLLRAVRQSGDLRTAGLILAGWESTHPRVRREARRAMADVERGSRAARNRWAGDYSLEEVRRFVEEYSEPAERMAEDPAAASFAAALTEAARYCGERRVGAELGE